MGNCAVCGKEVEGLSGVSIVASRQSLTWSEAWHVLCDKHREAVYEAAKKAACRAIDGAKGEKEGKV